MLCMLKKYLNSKKNKICEFINDALLWIQLPNNYR